MRPSKQANILMGCGASVDSGGGGGGSSTNELNVNRRQNNRFDAKSGLSDAETNPALLSMHMLFATYDTDAGGTIDATELLKMMKDVLSKASAKKKKPKKDDGNYSNWEDAMLSSALEAQTGGVVPTLRDVHEMMYAIGVEATQDELGQQTELSIEESVFIDWMLGGMKRSQSERDAFGSENDVQKKMVAFLEALLKLVERNISGIKFMFSDQGDDDDTPGGIDGEELYALMYKARGTPALRRVRKALLGIKDKKKKPPPMLDQQLVLRAVRQLDPTSRAGSRPILRETYFVNYMLGAFKQGAEKRRTIFQRDEVVVWMCAVLEFIKDTALPGMLSTERSEGGGASSNPMTSLALSSMVTEYDKDGDDKLNEAEFRRLVRACTKVAGYRLEASDEMSLSEFMQVFDKDRDGSVDHREFVDFMSGMMKLERDEVVAQGEFGMLQWYVVESAKLRVRFLTYALTELSTLVKATRATGASSKHSDPVTPSELTRLIKSCELSLEAAKLDDLLPNLHKGSSKSKNNNDGGDDGGGDEGSKKKNEGNFRVKDANKLIAFMDKNGDGELQTGEFVEAVMRSILQSKKSTRSQLKKAKLSKALEGMIAVLRTEVQRRVLVEASRVLFRRYDPKLIGEIDNAGLVELILGVAKNHNIPPP